MVSDATAAMNEEEHLSALINMNRVFADVMTTVEILERLGAG